jgi:large subunit ribosomal protein L15
MRQMDIIKRADEPVKVLADGEIKKALTVSAHKFSKNAKEKIEKAGGKVQLITKELPRVPSVS